MVLAVGEGGFEAVEEVWHCVLAPLATVLEYGVGRRAAKAAASTAPRLLDAIAQRPLRVHQPLPNYYHLSTS